MMTILRIEKILSNHSIYCEIRGDRIFAANDYTQNGVFHHEMINVTNWSRAKLYAWLGY